MGPATGPGIWSGTRDRLAETAGQRGAGWAPARVVHPGLRGQRGPRAGAVSRPAGPPRVSSAADPGEAAAKLAGPDPGRTRLTCVYDRGGHIRTGFSPRSAITHRVRVRRFATQKRAALAAHQSFLGDGRGRARQPAPGRWLALPAPLFGLVFGRGMVLVEPGARPPLNPLARSTIDRRRAGGPPRRPRLGSVIM